MSENPSFDSPSEPEQASDDARGAGVAPAPFLDGVRPCAELPAHVGVRRAAEVALV